MLTSRTTIESIEVGDDFGTTKTFATEEAPFNKLKGMTIAEIEDWILFEFDGTPVPGFGIDGELSIEVKVSTEIHNY